MYIDAIEGQAFLKKDPITGKEEIKRPKTLAPSASRLGLAVFFMGCYLYFHPIYNIADHYKTSFIASTSIPYRFVLLYLALLTERFKFYFVWKAAEASSIRSGFGFEGYDKMTGLIVCFLSEFFFLTCFFLLLPCF
jgi:hypothetical protein